MIRPYNYVEHDIKCCYTCKHRLGFQCLLFKRLVYELADVDDDFSLLKNQYISMIGYCTMYTRRDNGSD